MGANLQTSLCDCFEKSPKTSTRRSTKSQEVTLTPKTKSKPGKKTRFLENNNLTANLTQKIMSAQDAVLLHSSSKNPKKQITLQSFSVIRILGKGASGKVLLVKKADSNQTIFGFIMK